MTSNKTAALAGVAFVVLVLIADFVGGSMPKTSDSAAKIASFFAHHHKALLVGAVLSGASSPLFVWLFASLARTMRRLGSPALSVLVFGFIVAGTATATAADAAAGAVVHAATQGDSQFAKSGYDLSAFFAEKSFWFAAFAALAVWLGSKSMARWYGWLTLAAGVLFVLGGIGVRQHGFLATFGAATFIAFITLLVWVLATSFVLWQTADVEEAPN
jgi:hypothetical protein